MVSAPGKRMGCCCFGASPSMRIVASWFGSNGSTGYKDVAVGFFTTIVNLKAGSASCRCVVLKSSDRPPPPDSWGRSASADHHPIASTTGTKKRKQTMNLLWRRLRPRSNLGCRRAQANQGQALRVAAKDAASLDRPCARRPRDLAVGAEECSRRGVEPKNGPNRLRRHVL
jgi:hypothetical protein